MNKNERIEEIIKELKIMFVDRLMLPYEADEINENILIFEIEDIDDENIETLGLDSVDVLEIMAGINSLYKIKLDPENRREAYKTVRTLAEAIYDIQEKGL